MAIISKVLKNEEVTKDDLVINLLKFKRKLNFMNSNLIN